jgi:hypothetical protein
VVKSGFLLTLALLAGALTWACGGAGPDKVIARVGDGAITEEALAHAISLAGASSRSGTPNSPDLATHALEGLITRSLLIGEAARLGVAPSRREIQTAIRNQEASLHLSSRADFASFLEAAHERISDLESELGEALAIARLRGLALKTLKPTTAQAVRREYRLHLSRYYIPSRREVLITNRKTAARAEAVRRAIGARESFAHGASRETYTDLRPGAVVDKPALVRAIFGAPLGRIVGPVKASVDYFVFEVVRVFPAGYERMAAAEAGIRAHQEREARREALDRFIARMATAWRSRIRCHVSFLPPDCGGGATALERAGQRILSAG